VLNTTWSSLADSHYFYPYTSKDFIPWAQSLYLYSAYTLDTAIVLIGQSGLKDEQYESIYSGKTLTYENLVEGFNATIELYPSQKTNAEQYLEQWKTFADNVGVYQTQFVTLLAEIIHACACLRPFPNPPAIGADFDADVWIQQEYRSKRTAAENPTMFLSGQTAFFEDTMDYFSEMLTFERNIDRTICNHFRKITKLLTTESDTLPEESYRLQETIAHEFKKQSEISKTTKKITQPAFETLNYIHELNGVHSDPSDADSATVCALDLYLATKSKTAFCLCDLLIHWSELAYTGPRGDEHFTRRISIIRVPDAILADFDHLQL